MIENIRKFQAGPDPFGSIWDVEFRGLQTAISIRHSDSVDVKWEIRCGDEVLEKVVALMHPHLLKLSKAAGRPLTDPWCMKLAAAHLIRMIETAEDFEKTLVTVTYEQLEEYNAKLDSLVGAAH